MLGFFTLTTIIYAAKEGVHAPSFGDFKPTYALFIGLVPVLFFNYVGFELPSTAGDEMENPQRDVPFTVLRSAVASILLYGVPILAIIIVLPAAALSGLGGFIDAMKTVFTVYGGNVDDRQRRHAHGHAVRRRHRARRPDGADVHLGAAVQRHHLDHGRRPGARRRLASTAAARGSWARSRPASARR